VVLDLALNNEERLSRQLEATRDRFEVGEVARTDVAQAEARLSRARADVEQAKADLASSRAFYERVVGEPPAELQEPKILADLPKTEAETRAFAAQNPDIVAATFDLYAARDDVDVNFSDLLPSLDLQGQLEYADQPTAQTEWGRTAALGLNLSIPLYQGGGEFARVRESRQRVRQRRDQLETAHHSVQELVTASWERLLAATAAIDAFRAEVRANQIALEGVQQEALVGARTVLDVLDAEQELFTSQVNLVRASREEILASYQLKLAVGQLTVEGLSLPVQAYNPETYYDLNRTRLFGLSD
jgi:TolC family type I secretion outer membrane protein